MRCSATCHRHPGRNSCGVVPAEHPAASPLSPLLTPSVPSQLTTLPEPRVHQPPRPRVSSLRLPPTPTRLPASPCSLSAAASLRPRRSPLSTHIFHHLTPASGAAPPPQIAGKCADFVLLTVGAHSHYVNRTKSGADHLNAIRPLHDSVFDPFATQKTPNHTNTTPTRAAYDRPRTATAPGTNACAGSGSRSQTPAAATKLRASPGENLQRTHAPALARAARHPLP